MTDATTQTKPANDQRIDPAKLAVLAPAPSYATAGGALVLPEHDMVRIVFGEVLEGQIFWRNSVMMPTSAAKALRDNLLSALPFSPDEAQHE